MTNRELTDALLRRKAIDEALGREAMEVDVTGDDPELNRRLRDMNREHALWLEGVLDRHGWPGTSQVGSDAGEAAWLLAQHADVCPDVQQRALDLLGAAVAAGDAPAWQLAYLTDRVRTNKGEPQIYGTQWHPVAGRMVRRPIEDPRHVDDRRAAMGLPPMRDAEEAQEPA